MAEPDMTAPPVASVVIPAHNEAAVIGRCLDRLLEDRGIDLQVVVVANGCTDGTAAAADRPGVLVVETPIGNKAHALNLGDRACSVFPRLYLDADIELGTAAVRQIVDALRSAEVVAPRLHWTDEHMSSVVRAYYSVWTALPYHRAGVVGSGLMALSERGRARFDEFPDLIADDGFVSAQFTADERRPMPDCTFLMRPPRDIRSLLAVKSRVWLGNEQLNEYLRRNPVANRAAAAPRRTGARWDAYVRLLREPRLYPALPVYAGIYLVARVAGRLRMHRQDLGWSRDQSSRTG